MIEGPYGKAYLLDYSASPVRENFTDIASYLGRLPKFHPLWSDYYFSLVHLREKAGVKTANLRFPGASHEIMIIIDVNRTQTDADILTALDALTNADLFAAQGQV